MATIQDAIKAYHLHTCTGMLNELNNLFKEHHYATSINQKLAKHLFEGGHQKELPYRTNIHYAETFVEMSKALCHSSLMTDSYTDFEKLYEEVFRLLDPISGIGSLTIYDVALRIGFIRRDQILPEKKIYLYRGARLGAENFRKAMPNLFGDIPEDQLNKRGELREGSYDIRLFDQSLQDMGSMFLEDFFCCYHRELKKMPTIGYDRFQKVGNFYDICLHA